MSQYLGDISAYALAVSQGYTGTEEEYAELMASYATVGQTAVTAAQTATTKALEAATSATTATNKASEATTAATTATTAAEAAQADADAAALDASQAMSAASTATTKATEATTAAATATSAKTDAVAANTAAQSAKTAAQTAQAGAETAAASVSASAAQIQTNADDISELKEDLTVVFEHTASGSSESSGNTWVLYDVKKGHTYKFVNNSNRAITLNTTGTYGAYDYVERFGNIAAGGTRTFVATGDAKSVNVYAGGASAWTIEELSTIGEMYEKVKTIDGLTAESAKIPQIVDALKLFTQYIDHNAWKQGYYSVSGTTVNYVAASSPWYCQKIENLKAGTYYFNSFCSPDFTAFVDKVTGTVSKASDLGVVQGAPGSLTFSNAFDAYITIYGSATLSKDTAMFADGQLPSDYVYGLYKIDGLYTNANGQTVWVVGNGYIPTIQGACALAADNDIIFIRCGTYTEQVSIWTRKLHLIGEDKLNTIIIDHSGNYDTPPLEMAKGSISNLTIIEDGANPTVSPEDSRYMMAYCLHIEHPNAAGETFEIDNCNFINHIHVPLGCGLRANNTVRFRNCRFYCGATDESVSNERGAFFVHSENSPNVNNQWIIAENCVMESKGPRLAAMFGVPSGAANTGSMYIRLSNCNLWNENSGIADSTVTFDTGGGTDVMQLSHSYGNTINALNS